VSRRLALVALLATVAVARAVGSADAAGTTPEKQGWWSATGAPVPTLVPGVNGSTSAAPDVPDGGLYVAGSSTSPFAVSALRYRLPAGATATTLSLTKAPGSLMVPGTKVRACPLTGDRDFDPAEGGSLTDAPVWDCDRGVDGVLDPAGIAFTFPIGPLAADGVLAIAIVPGGSDDRIAFAGPDPTALPLTEPSPARPTTTRTAVTTPGQAPSPRLPSVPRVPAPPVTASPRAATPAPAAGPSGGAPTAAPSATPTRPIGLASRAGRGAPSAMAGALGVALLAIAVWWRGRKLLSTTLAGMTLTPSIEEDTL
jgi:hypothetical protein